MNDLEQGYAALADEADRVALAGPEALRARADHRHRVKAVAACAAVLLVVGGAAVGARWAALAGPDPAPRPGQTPTVTPPPAPTTAPRTTAPITPTSPPAASATGGAAQPGTQRSTAAQTAPSSVPVRAFLQAADTNGGSPSGLAANDALPDLCGATYPATSSIKAQRYMQVIYWTTAARHDSGNVPDGSYAEGIRSFRGAGAAGYMAQLRRAAKDCPKGPNGDGTVRVLPGDGYGDESFLIRYSHPEAGINGEPTGGTADRWVSVVRIGGVVMTLYERGYESGWISQAEHEVFTAKAVQRMRSWLRG